MGKPQPTRKYSLTTILLSMKKIIKTKNAPAPIGPYNQAVLVGDTLYVSGQIAMDPATGELLQGTIEIETEQVMHNLRAVLAAAGADFSQVAKSTIFVKDMGQFSRINEVYGKFFSSETAPARETVEVSNLPKYVNVEISVIAVVE